METLNRDQRGGWTPSSRRRFADVSFIATLSTDASGAVVSPVDDAASAAASDDAAPADDSRAPTAPLSGVAEGTVPLVVGAAFDAAVLSAEAAPPHRRSGENSGVAAGSAAGAAPADDVGASATPSDDTSGKTRVPVIASVAGAAAASVTAVGADCCGPSNREHRHLHTFRLKPLLNSPAITAKKVPDRGLLLSSPSPPIVGISDGCCSGCCCRACRAGGKAWEL